MCSSYYISTTTRAVVMILMSRYMSRLFLGLAGAGSRDSLLDLADKGKLIEATIRVRLPRMPYLPMRHQIRTSTPCPLLHGWCSAGDLQALRCYLAAIVLQPMSDSACVWGNGRCVLWDMSRIPGRGASCLYIKGHQGTKEFDAIKLNLLLRRTDAIEASKR